MRQRSSGVVWVVLLAAGVPLLAGGCAGEQKQPTVGVKTYARKKDGRRASGASAGSNTAVAQAQKAESGAPPSDVAQVPTSVTPRKGEAPTGLVESARGSVRNGQHEAAIRQCKAALRRDEKYTPAMEVMARAYFHLGKTEFAGAICDIALSIEPASGRCHNLKGFIALREDDAPRALAAFRKATDADAGYGPAWLNLGAQYLRVKNYGEAAPALERAAELLGERPEVFLNLGAAYRGAGQPVKARKAFDKALKLRRGYAAAYFNLGILFLDAENYPGIAKVPRLQLALLNLTKYKQARRSRSKDDPVDTYLQSAQRGIQRETRRIERAKRRKAREAAKKVKQAEEAKAAEKAKQAEEAKAAAEKAKKAEEAKAAEAKQAEAKAAEPQK